MASVPDVRTARGVVLGLLLGDAVGAVGGNVAETGPLQAGSGGQLACYTVEGLIRAHVRGMHKGICHPPSVVWYAYRRWAAGRGEIRARDDDAWWRNSGWLVDVPALAEPRGSAPATVAALRAADAPGSGDAPVRSSLGAHAVVRALPAGLCDWGSGPGRLGGDIAALTHAGEAITAAAVGAELISHLCSGRSFDDAVEAVLAALPGWLLAPLSVDLAAILDAARARPGDPATIRRLAPDAKASSALAGGLYVAAQARPTDIPDALRLAASAGDGGHAATAAGALLGALHGPDSLPINWLARMELVWVGDTLARDLVRQITENPSGDEHAPATDPVWWDRYPGS